MPVSTTRPSSERRIAAAAPPVKASAPESAPHSACQAPIARSCSATTLSASTEAWPRARRAHAPASTAPTGLRFWGIADEPPGSASATSRDLGLGEQGDVDADLGAGSRGAGERRAELGDHEPVRVPREQRLGQPELRGEQPQHLQRVVSERGERAGGAAELRRQRSRRGRTSRTRAVCTSTSQPAALKPNVVGTACWSSVRAAIGVSRWRRASPAQSSSTALSSWSTIASARFATSIAALSMMSWLVAPKCT